MSDYEQDDIPKAVPPEVKRRKNNMINLEQSVDTDGTWLTSYADLMTLVACFFILMVAMANFDPVQFSKHTNTIAKAFSGKEVNNAPDDLVTKLKLMVDENIKLKEMVKSKLIPNGIEISFSGTGLFDAGSSQLTPDKRDSLDVIIDLVKEHSKDAKVIVEGHTDSAKLIKHERFNDNWELSSSRAASVVRQFQDRGFPGSSLVALGYGSTRPVLPNFDQNGKPLPGNMAANRRIVVKVIQTNKQQQRLKLGLGVYLDENQIADSAVTDPEPVPSGTEVEVNGQVIRQ